LPETETEKGFEMSCLFKNLDSRESPKKGNCVI